MIDALRYEPQSQRFEPRERQRSEAQYRHIHLHLHLRFRVRQTSQGRPTHPTAISVTRIFAALVCATLMAFTLFLPVINSGPSTPFQNIAQITILAGLVVAWGAVLIGGLPLFISALYSKLRIRFLLTVPLIIPLLFMIFIPPISRAVGAVINVIPLGFLLLFYAYPIISAISVNHAIRQAEIADKWLRFASKLSYVVVFGMALILLGGLLWGPAFLLISGMDYSWYNWLPFLSGMCVAFIVAVHALFSRSRARDYAQPRPKDDAYPL